MSRFLGIDLGTTYFKAGLFDESGRLLGLGRVHVQKEESGGRCELPVARFWDHLASATGACLASAGVEAGAVAALGYSSQANSFVLLDSKGIPLTPLVLWPDRRAEGRSGGEDDPWNHPEFLARTGVGVGSAEFAAHKLAWFRDERPALWRKVAMAQTLSDHFVFGLTGSRRGDRSTAALLGLWDQRPDAWWIEGLRRLRVDPDWMSTMLRPGTLAGVLTEGGAARIGLRPGLPLVLGGLDHYAAALGAGLHDPGELCESTGTVLACVALNERFSPRSDACIGPAFRKGSYYELAFSAAGAANLDWYRDRFAPGLAVPELIALAEAVPPGCHGLRARAVLFEGPPDRAFTNAHETHGQGHYVRAVLEANARALEGLIERLGPGRRPRRILATGGGARSEVWLQIKADLLGVEVVQPDCEEPACQGAAWLAAHGCGMLPAGSQPSDWRRIRKRLLPDPVRHRLYREIVSARPS